MSVLCWSVNCLLVEVVNIIYVVYIGLFCDLCFVAETTLPTDQSYQAYLNVDDAKDMRYRKVGYSTSPKI